MAKIEKSPLLGRKIRRDDWPEIGKPTWTFLEEAIKAGKTKEALELLEYALFEARTGHHVYVLFANLWNDYIGQKYGEDAIEGFWRALRARPPEQLPTYYMPSHADKVVGNPKESVILDAEFQRCHFAGLSDLGEMQVTEEPDRYVVTVHCGTGGRARRSKLHTRTQKPHPWSWGKTGVPYYCCHCCLFWEIMPMQQRGVPLKVHENVDKPDEPCIHIYYKKPELIPEHYYTRVGMTKPKSFK